MHNKFCACLVFDVGCACVFCFVNKTLCVCLVVVAVCARVICVVGVIFPQMFLGRCCFVHTTFCMVGVGCVRVLWVVGV